MRSVDASPTPPTAPPTAPSAATRTRALDETPALAARTIEFLKTPGAQLDLTDEDARCIVGVMRLATFPRGTLLFRAGDDAYANHMLLVLDGEVSVEIPDDNGLQLPISVLGPGSMIGEMAMLGNSARSANCSALSDVQAAGMGRRGLDLLIEEHPKVAVKLLFGLNHRVAERLRALSEQVHLVSQLNASLQDEVARLRGRGG